MLIMRVIRSSLHLLEVVRCESEEKRVSLERTRITNLRTVLPFASFRRSGYLGSPSVPLPLEGYLPGAILPIHGKHQSWLYSPINKITLIICIIRQGQKKSSYVRYERWCLFLGFQCIPVDGFKPGVSAQLLESFSVRLATETFAWIAV